VQYAAFFLVKLGYYIKKALFVKLDCFLKMGGFFFFLLTMREDMSDSKKKRMWAKTSAKRD
jgi:hypothetical protein